MHHILTVIIPYVTHFLELFGVLIIVIGTGKAIYDLFKARLDFGDIAVKINFAKALALALEFKLAAEILNTVLIHTTKELYILSVIVILRVVMTFVIHWEIKNSERDMIE
ncbi:DUF1622 domain-containing protein [Streptococcus marimammalium]|uniref:DUF1622 domain-containing protein n=1 Tax=Streptococcus marimammalium TaxID=269666 RepID=UPI00036EF754|nr:DUF1622 domain-containing protein [Streptococcus marimammalium]